jgi:hypothetical protein
MCIILGCAEKNDPMVPKSERTPLQARVPTHRSDLGTTDCEELERWCEEVPF